MPMRSASRAWMTSVPSSSSSRIVRRYSTTGGRNPLIAGQDTATSPKARPSARPRRSQLLDQIGHPQLAVARLATALEEPAHALLGGRDPQGLLEQMGLVEQA